MILDPGASCRETGAPLSRVPGNLGWPQGASTAVAGPYRRAWLLSRHLRPYDRRRLCRRSRTQDAGVTSTLSSTANPEVRRLVRLQRAAGRRELGAFVVEGRRAIAAYLAAGWQPRACYLRADLDPPEEWAERSWRRISTAVATRCSTQRSPSGYLAEFALPGAATLDPARGGLVLAGVADPGNAGTLLRSAAAFALGQVLILGGADPWSPKVVQAGAGAQAILALRRVEAAAVAELEHLAAGAACCALVVAGGAPDLPPPPRWLVVGSEAHGLDPALLAACSHRLSLPMPGGSESLNAGVAGSIACFLAAGLADLRSTGTEQGVEKRPAGG